MSFKKILFICSLILFNAQIQAQLTTLSASGMTPQLLVQNNLVGTGVTVSNVKFNGSLSTISCNAIGTFSTSGPTNLGLTHGLIMCSGHVSVAQGPNNAQGMSAISGCTTIADPQLQAIATGTIYDCATLEFDFIPLSDTIKFRYVFASEEYPEFVNQSVNDVFGFFITGMNPTGPNYVNKNIALIPGTNTVVCINNVNNGYFPGCPTNQTTGICTNCNYYVNNCGGTAIQYDGFTTVLTAWALVIPCTSYHLKMAIADVQDPVWDSGVFFEANSFSSPLIAVDTTFSLPTASTHDAIEGCNNIILTFKLPYPAPYPKNIQIKSVSGTATNGVDYPLLPNMLIIPTGSDSVQLVIAPIWDHIPEPTETIVIVYQEINSCYPDTLRFNILNYDSLTAVAYGDTTLCYNTTPLSVVAQHGITPYQYNWSNGAGNTAIVNPTFNATTQYNITVKDACLKTVKDSVLVTVFCDFARAGPDTTICLGGSANLHASIDTNVHHIIGT
ncbi:MAG: choice-of-anchor L domain-containing protein, partial [Bacteroidetes bacterium]|nr:choice-of-anchor L domain-containing protein [Bacteroidota bacterium]